MRWIRSAPVLFFLWSLAYAQTYEGTVIGVSDGDTLIMLTPEKRQIKVRLAEIDAPEKSQAHGQRSKESLSGLTFGKQVRVEQQDRDRYGRVVGKVYIDGLDVNTEQIKRGLAWVYRKYAHNQALFAMEQEAKDNKLGLWIDPHAIPPWEYRRGGKTGISVTSVRSKLLVQARVKAGNSFQCGAKRYCNQMTSCEEAEFYLIQCGLTRLDGDSDGGPCESLCR